MRGGRIGLALAAVALLAACSGKTTSPAGWQRIPDATNGWTHGSGSTLEEYFYSKKPFSGTLSDLASLETIKVVLQRRGAKLIRSVPFGPCPGWAGLAEFKLGKLKSLQEGFSVQNGRSVLVTYVGPKSAPVDPAVAQAMQAALCGGVPG